MRTTAAIVNEQGGDFLLEEVDLEGPREDEVLVRILAAGICHTDIHLKGMFPEAMFPKIFGHEGAGIVEAVGAAVSGIKAGDHVVLSFRSCRACGNCTNGLVGYCEAAMMLNYAGVRLQGWIALQQLLPTIETHLKDGSWPAPAKPDLPLPTFTPRQITVSCAKGT